jgi:hypothetical protein
MGVDDVGDARVLQRLYDRHLPPPADRSLSLSKGEAL